MADVAALRLLQLLLWWRYKCWLNWDGKLITQMVKLKALTMITMAGAASTTETIWQHVRQNLSMSYSIEIWSSAVVIEFASPWKPEFFMRWMIKGSMKSKLSNGKWNEFKLSAERRFTKACGPPKWSAAQRTGILSVFAKPWMSAAEPIIIEL